ncbi:MAG: hypothetical protein R2879_04430 [Saprospiraceae bacterium]
MKNDKKLPQFKMAYYLKKDWDRLMNSIVDRDSMHDTWEEWHAKYMETKKYMESQGCVVHDIIIDIDQLNDYCRRNGLANDGKTRSSYVGKFQLPLN